MKAVTKDHMSYDILYVMSKIGKCTETERILVVFWGWRIWGAWWKIAQGHGISFSGKKNVLKLIVMVVAKLCEYIKKY